MTRLRHLHDSTIIKPGDAFRALTATTLNLTTTSEAFKHGKLAYAAQDNDEAVRHYTKALETLKEDLSVIHVHRAAAFEMQNKFQEAVHDGLAADPGKSSIQPDLYLTLGNALFLHDQVQESVDTYERGMRMVPETNPRHELLVEKYHQTMDFMEKRNRQIMFESLPFEVHSGILSELSIKDRARLGMTCRFWNTYIREIWPYMWKAIDTRKDMFGFPRDNTGFLDAIQGDQVRELYVHFEDPARYYYDGEYDSDDIVHDKKDAGVAILDTMIDGGWKHIRKLSLWHCTEANFEKIAAVSQSSLYELTLRDSKGHNNYGLGMVSKAASEFPNLQIISNHVYPYLGSTWLLDYVRDTAQMSSFQLTSLSMSWHFDKKSFDTFISICQHLPALASLTIDPELFYDYSTILGAIARYCPVLETFQYTKQNAKDKLCATYTSQRSAFTGLRTVVMHPTMKYYAETSDKSNVHMATVLQRAHSTLENLDLDLRKMDCAGHVAFETLAQLGAPKLQTLSLYTNDDTSITPRMFKDFISSCRSLVDIKIDGLKADYLDSILDALATCTSIRRVHLNVCELSSYDTLISSIHVFFKEARHIYSFSLNSSIDFEPADQLILGLTQAVLNSYSTQCLNLSTYKMTKGQLLGALKNLKKSQVQTLKIRVAFAIDDSILNALANIQHLTHLLVYGDRYFDEIHVYNLLARWQKPQMLVVEAKCKDSQGSSISAHKPALGAMRQVKERSSDPRRKYSIIRR